MRLRASLLGLLTLGVPSISRAQVVINEVLSNEPGGSTSLEWVELYNSDSATVSLSGWKFAEGADTTYFATQDTIVPRGYLILARK